jgi:hypoxanthine phosphoribosyltransferase
LNHNTSINEESSPKEYCSWIEIEELVKEIVNLIQRSKKKYDLILAITNGGIIPARLLARELDIDNIQFIPIRNKKLYREEMLPLDRNKKYLVVDDIYDTGDTFSKVFAIVKDFDCDFAFLLSRYRDNNAPLVAKILDHERWIVFPWEIKRY